MRILHLLRSEPDEMTRLFIEEVSRDREKIEVSLEDEEVDYDRLIEELFRSDQVVSWW